MRDAFGGVFTMNFLLVFIFIFVAFTAVSLNYAKAFRVKNAVIDFVEENELVALSAFSTSPGTPMKYQTKLAEILRDLNYTKTCDSLNLDDGEIKSSEGIVIGYCFRGVIFQEIKREKVNDEKNKPIYETISYKITTYADWNLGALNKLLALAGKGEDSEGIIKGTWGINGEAKVVKKY